MGLNNHFIFGMSGTSGCNSLGTIPYVLWHPIEVNMICTRAVQYYWTALNAYPMWTAQEVFLRVLIASSVMLWNKTILTQWQKPYVKSTVWILLIIFTGTRGSDFHKFPPPERHLCPLPQGYPPFLRSCIAGSIWSCHRREESARKFLFILGLKD